MIISKTSLFVASVLLGLSVPARAFGSPSFPGVTEQELKLSTAPECIVCHSSPSGGIGTVTTTFGSYLRSRGLRASDDASLRTALAAATAEKHDSDGDGVTDVDQLRAGLDPNGSAVNQTPPAQGGCGGHVSPHSSSPAAMSCAVSFLALLVLSLRRARRP